MINGPQREKKRMKSDTKRGFCDQRREMYATLRDVSTIAEEQQALSSVFSPRLDYFCIYCPDLHKCQEAGSFYDLQRACEHSGRVILAFNFKWIKKKKLFLGWVHTACPWATCCEVSFDMKNRADKEVTRERKKPLLSCHLKASD